MSTTLTIRLDDKLGRALTRFARRTGHPKSEFAREALRRQIAVARFEEARRIVLPFADARGLCSDLLRALLAEHGIVIGAPFRWSCGAIC